jgi:AAA+ ATPase superfamily predicted ATPase
MQTKTAQLHDERRIKAAERAADEFGSFNAFIRVMLDEYDDELRLEREVEELAEELESKRDRLEELQQASDEAEQKEQEQDADSVPDELKQFYTADKAGDGDD